MSSESIYEKLNALKKEIIDEIKVAAGDKYIRVNICTHDPECNFNEVYVAFIGRKVGLEEYSDLFELESFDTGQLAFFLKEISREIKENSDLIEEDSIYATEEEVFDYLNNSV